MKSKSTTQTAAASWATATWIDAHCHLADPRFNSDRMQILERSKKAGVGAWIQGGYSPEDWVQQLDLRNQIGPDFVPSFGLHPMWVSQKSPEEVQTGFETLKKLICEAQGLGELGLDYRKKVCTSSEIRSLQVEYFEKQLVLNQSVQKPLVLHIVHAHGDAIQILKNHGPYPAGGLVHSFSGSYEVARDYVSMGFLISLGGGVTQKGFQNLKNTLTCLPFESMVIETDAPDQLPHLPELKGSDPRNQPAYLVNVARFLEESLGRSASEILDQSSSRLRKLFFK
jgi:TatD DNase family protein